VQLVQSACGDGFVRREIKDWLGGFIVASNGDAVVWSEAREKCVDSLQVGALEEINGWACFDEEQDLGRPVHAEEISDGLLGAVVENMEVFTGEASHELTA